MGAERDVGGLERGPHAAHVGVGLAVGRAGEAVVAAAPQAAAGLGIGLVEVDTEREMERLVAGSDEIVVELLDAGLVRDGGVWEGARAARLGWVLARLTVHEVEPFGLRVVGLELGVRDRPCRRDAAVVIDRFEVTLAKAEERSSVDLRVAADDVVRLGAERSAVLVIPALGGVVSLAAEDLPGVPVLALAREVAAALEQQDALARWRKTMGQRPAAGTGPDDDHVVVIHAPALDERDRRAPRAGLAAQP